MLCPRGNWARPMNFNEPIWKKGIGDMVRDVVSSCHS